MLESTRKISYPLFSNVTGKYCSKTGPTILEANKLAITHSTHLANIINNWFKQRRYKQMRHLFPDLSHVMSVTELQNNCSVTINNFRNVKNTKIIKSNMYLKMKKLRSRRVKNTQEELGLGARTPGSTSCFHLLL